MSPSLAQALLADGPGGNGDLKESRCPLREFALPEVFNTHPGGQEHLKTAEKSDCPGLLFLAYHIGLDMDGAIGNALKARGLTIPETGTFYDELDAIVRKIKEEHKGQRYIFHAWCLVITALLLPSFVWLMVSPGLLPCLSVSLLFELYFLNIFHTRHHKGGNIYDSAFLNSALNPVYHFIDSTWGYYPPAWKWNHHVRHHMHTNEDDTDPDLPATYPLIRMFQEQEKLWYHKFQTLYWPMLLPFSVARYPISNLFEHGGPPVFFAAWLALMFVLPAALHGVEGVLWCMLVLGLTGVNVTYKFAVSHAHADLVRSPEHEKKKGIKELTTDDFMRDQIEESIDWGGYWSTLIFGGINLQIEHHVAPALDPPLLALLAPELRKLCGHHKVRYTEEPTFFHAVLKLHLRLWLSG